MKKKTLSRILLGAIMTTSFAVISFTALSISWFKGPNVDTRDDNFLDGEIGLRNYFFSGDGTEERPYEIVTPVHYYNLTRLQNLGIFAGKTYFQVGHVFDIDGVPSLRCIDHYDDQGDPVYSDYLDMGEFSEDNTIMTIGGEGVPFVGDFNGNGLPIKNLKVQGNPEDIGVFGYIANEGNVHGLVLDNVEVTSLGYNNNSSSDEYQLFSQDIDDIFHSASFLATETDCYSYIYKSASGSYVSDTMKKLNGTAGTELFSIDSSTNLISGTDVVKAYFKPQFPTSGGSTFTYDIISSSPLIKKYSESGVTIAGADDTCMVIDITNLENHTTFGSTNGEVKARMYLTASVKVDGHTFTRVIQSYEFEFYSNHHAYGEGYWNANVFCDYVDQGSENDKVTGYHHGVNVGLIAGHLDGTMKDCYVYTGKLKFNETGYHPIAAESDTALIGEAGVGVANEIDPDLGLVVNGDIGVMNFSKIYSNIRSDFTGGELTYAGRRVRQSDGATIDYVSYHDKLQPGYVNYLKYLRYADGKKDDNMFITGTDTDTTTSMHGSSDYVWHQYTVPSTVPNSFNAVSFLWNNVIEDDEVDRGLGVFKIVTSYNNQVNYDEYGAWQVEDIYGSRIINGTPQSKVYFSTAEFDHSKSSGSWTTPMRATTLPSYSDVSSFDYPFSRDYNYVFELDLSQMQDSGGNDYMYNTDSDFLANYLSSKLRDREGNPVTRGSPRFGFMFRSSENESLSSLSSYMPVSKPGTKQAFTNPVTLETRYYPSNSIVFRIENKHGANVSVVGNHFNICIYSYDPTTSAGGVTAKYTMKSSSSNSTDQHRYFTYNINGQTSTTATINKSMSESNALYGHIFYLPQGDYVIGSTSDKEAEKANIYFLAVQGQTEGTIGSKDEYEIDGEVKDVDFLLAAPTYTAYTSGLSKAAFSFRSLYNTASGLVTIDAVTVGSKKYMRIAFATSPKFLLRILTYTRNNDHTCMINGAMCVGQNYEYLAE